MLTRHRVLCSTDVNKEAALEQVEVVLQDHPAFKCDDIQDRLKRLTAMFYDLRDFAKLPSTPLKMIKSRPQEPVKKADLAKIKDVKLPPGWIQHVPTNDAYSFALDPQGMKRDRTRKQELRTQSRTKHLVDYWDTLAASNRIATNSTRMRGTMFIPAIVEMDGRVST